MVTARCNAAGRGAECNHCDGGGDFVAGDCHPRTLQPTVNCCMACCYASGVTAAAAVATKKYCATTRDKASAAAAAVPDADYDGPPSEAAAFVASVSAAAFVLLAALLAVVLSWVAVLCLASLAPTAVAATGVPAGSSGAPPLTAADYLDQWHNQQYSRRDAAEQQSRPYPQWQQQQRFPGQPYGAAEDDAVRRKRQLLLKNNNNREPGIVGLTFSLIGGTISDAREAYRNVTGIVRDTLSVAARVQQPATTAAAATDQMMMAAVNTADNEITGSSTAAVPVDQNAAGQAFSRLFGRNYRGLRRLFNSELRTALKNSPGNVRDFTVELLGSIGQSLRPSNLITRGPINNDSKTTGSRR